MPMRFAKETDIPAMLDIYGPYVEHTAYSFEYTVPTCEEFTARFQSYTRQFPWLVWEHDGQVVGYAYGSAPFERAAYRWCAEVSVYIHPDYHGQGIGRELYHALEKLIFAQGYRVIYSLITTDNAPSLAFHERMGYRRVAELPGCGIKFGRELGIIYMEKRSIFVEIPTEFPVSIWEVVKNHKNPDAILDRLSLSQILKMCYGIYESL